MNDEITRIELEDELDLHHFDPKDAKAVLLEFIETAVSKGKKEIRIVHGKGKSTLKTIVQKELERNSKIKGYLNDGSNWGATIAFLK
jgi:DNA-nicking Smr family endonuclease